MKHKKMLEVNSPQARRERMNTLVEVHREEPPVISVNESSPGIMFYLRDEDGYVTPVTSRMCFNMMEEDKAKHEVALFAVAQTPLLRVPAKTMDEWDSE